MRPLNLWSFGSPANGIKILPFFTAVICIAMHECAISSTNLANTKIRVPAITLIFLRGCVSTIATLSVISQRFGNKVSLSFSKFVTKGKNIICIPYQVKTVAFFSNPSTSLGVFSYTYTRKWKTLREYPKTSLTIYITTVWEFPCFINLLVQLISSDYE